MNTREKKEYIYKYIKSHQIKATEETIELYKHLYSIDIIAYLYKNIYISRGYSALIACYNELVDSIDDPLVKDYAQRTYRIIKPIAEIIEIRRDNIYK